MATETLKWITMTGGTAAIINNQSLDTGTVIANATTNYTSPSFAGSTASGGSQFVFYNSGSGVKMTANFTDDTSDSVVSGAFDASFTINDIDAGSSTGFRDQVTIKALDINGKPLKITASPGANFTVTTNPDGSVTLTAKLGTNSDSSLGSRSQINIAGGPISSISVEFQNLQNGSNDLYMSDITYNTASICFAAGTMILTDRGEVAVEDLRVGDLVHTRDSGLQEIRWMDSQRLSGETLTAATHLCPIRIKAGALGENTPARDLVVSPQHRILVRSRIAQKMFGTDEVLITAKQLLLVEGIDVATDLDGVEYYHFLFDDHQVVIANGAEAESLYTGPQALKFVGPAARAEIFEIFPHLAELDYEARSARPLASGRMGRRLAHRHIQNNKMLVS